MCTHHDCVHSLQISDVSVDGGRRQPPPMEQVYCKRGHPVIIQRHDTPMEVRLRQRKHAQRPSPSAESRCRASTSYDLHQRTRVAPFFDYTPQKSATVIWRLVNQSIPDCFSRSLRAGTVIARTNPRRNMGHQ